MMLIDRVVQNVPTLKNACNHVPWSPVALAMIGQSLIDYNR